MNADVLLNLLNELKRDKKTRLCCTFYHFLATSLINLIIEEHKS